MLRRLMIAAAAVLMLGAARPATVDYRVSLEPQASGPGVLAVEIRLRGDTDGETRLALPDDHGASQDSWRFISDLKIKGATTTEDGPAFRLLRHRPGAKIVVTYRVRTADPGAVIRPDGFAFIGDVMFIIPEGRERQPATFRWGAMPRGWTVASDLDHGAMGRPLTVDDIEESVAVGGAQVRVVQRPVSGGVLRVASLTDRPIPLEPLADQIAASLSAQRTFWGEGSGPYFVGVIPLVRDGDGKAMGGAGRSDGFALWSTPGDPELVRWTVAREQARTWIPRRVGSIAPSQTGGAASWFTEGFTDFFTNRAMLKAGAWSADDVVGRMDAILRAYDANPARAATPHQRGQLLALKWDEDIRKASAGKADLTTVILRMRDHYQKFPPGQGPDVVTGLVSAAWVVAKIDLRPDIAKYADGGATIEFPEEMFDGCLQARVTVSPGFDSGFDAAGSFAGKVAKGVRSRGPAWSAGLRNGMRLDSWVYSAGDMNRQIELATRPANGKGRARKITFWPYGDVDVRARKLQLTPGMGEARRAECGRRIGGL